MRAMVSYEVFGGPDYFMEIGDRGDRNFDRLEICRTRVDRGQAGITTRGKVERAVWTGAEKSLLKVQGILNLLAGSRVSSALCQGRDLIHYW